MKIRRTYIYAAVYVLSLVGLAVIGYVVGDHYGLSRAHMMAGNGGSRNFASDVSFYDLPRMNLTLATTNNNKTGKVRIDISLEVEKKYYDRMKDYQPRLSDRIVTFVRNQDMDALREPYNQREFRKELVNEVNKVASPVPVLDVILRQMVFL